MIKSSVKTKGVITTGSLSAVKNSMCGIAGFITEPQESFSARDVITSMTTCLRHRGPDDHGTIILTSQNKSQLIGLGHQRLSILDLSDRGHQPMQFGDRYQLVFNGEIYNYVELRKELESLGHSFKSQTDTEVVLAAYGQWGKECFAKFNGMWGMALYDQETEELILSRDRFGKKPLFYSQQQNSFIFSSEIKSLLKFPSFDKKPNLEKVYRYLAGNYRYIDGREDTFFENVHLVPKGGLIVINRDLKQHHSLYWELSLPAEPLLISEEVAKEEIKALLIDSVKLRLRSDVPVGCMLSGGMDSTSITCIAAKILKQPIIAFSGVTGEQKGVYDESEYIDAVVNETGIEHHYIFPDPAELFPTINEMLDVHDEPICTVTWFSLYLIAKKIKEQNIPVILNGHGGDEFLAGYWEHYQYNFIDLLRQGKVDEYNHEVNCWQENHQRDMAEIKRTQKLVDRWHGGECTGMARYPSYAKVFQQEHQLQFSRQIDFLYEHPSWLTGRMAAEMLHETIPASLRPEDRNTMAFSLESRAPFLDYRLVEYGFKLPNHFKVRNGIGKWILREAMKDILPETVRLRKDKAGFIAPADQWFRETNRDEIWDLIHSSELANRKLYNQQELANVFQEHLDDKQNHQMFLWQFINAELWFRKFFD